jgi:hypothetical protein
MEREKWAPAFLSQLHWRRTEIGGKNVNAIE